LPPRFFAIRTSGVIFAAAEVPARAFSPEKQVFCATSLSANLTDLPIGTSPSPEIYYRAGK